MRAQTRALVGAWPGTLREARSRVLCGLPPERRAAFDAEALDALSRAVNDAARSNSTRASGKRRSYPARP